MPRRARIGDAVEAQHRKPAVAGMRAGDADLLVAGHHRHAGVGGEAFRRDRHDAVSRGAAMLHARHHLLADIAALVEIDAGELVHVGLVREGIAVDEIEAAARHAERDAVGLVGRRLEQLGAEIGRRLLGEMRRQHERAGRAPAGAGRR